MVEELRIRVEVLPEGVSNVYLEGELDDFSVTQFHHFFDTYSFSEYTRALHVHVAGLSFLDSVGLGVLVAFFRRYADKHIVLLAPQPQVRRLLDQSGLLYRGLFELHDDVTPEGR